MLISNRLRPESFDLTIPFQSVYDTALKTFNETVKLRADFVTDALGNQTQLQSNAYGQSDLTDFYQRSLTRQIQPIPVSFGKPEPTQNQNDYVDFKNEQLTTQTTTRQADDFVSKTEQRLQQIDVNEEVAKMEDEIDREARFEQGASSSRNELEQELATQRTSPADVDISNYEQERYIKNNETIYNYPSDSGIATASNTGIIPDGAKPLNVEDADFDGVAQNYPIGTIFYDTMNPEEIYEVVKRDESKRSTKSNRKLKKIRG